MGIQDKPLRAAAAGLLLGLVALGAAAQATNSLPPDKAGFNLFNPVPDTGLRELNSDRPDETESPYTVDAGHFQWEMDFANYRHAKTGGATTQAWNVAPFNLRAGLFDATELDLIFDNYLNVHSEFPAVGKSQNQSGVGDLTARLKINLWGNDGGKTAFALLPFVKFPTSTDGLGNNAVEGGLILPLAATLPGDFDLGCETGVHFGLYQGGGNYHADFLNSVTLDHALFGRLSGYLEFYSEISTEPRTDWVGTVDVGLEYLLTKNIQLDCGCNFGVTSAAADFNPFTGITVRF